MRDSRTLLLVCAVLAVGCAGYDDFGTSRPDGGRTGPDASSDSSAPVTDSGTPPRTDSGAPAPDTGTPPGPPPEGHYHPLGYEEVAAHGPDSNLQVEDCRDCHGSDLRGGTWRGGSVESCDSCHDPIDATWRTNCTFCHGGGETGGGAPPRGLDGRSDTHAFAPHTAHQTRTNHPAYACTECHAAVTDVMTPEHAFDSTPGRAEVHFNGINAGGTYDGSGGCASNYCHGDGTGNNGVTAVGDPTPDCGTCHAESVSLLGGFLGTGLGGQHGDHGGEACGDCHQGVTDSGNNVIGPDLHVNGTVEWSMEGTGITMTAGTCNGLCHGEFHFAKSW